MRKGSWHKCRACGGKPSAGLYAQRQGFVCASCSRTEKREARRKRIAEGRGGRNHSNRENRAYFLRQVGGKCEECGYNKHPEILQFDHVEAQGNKHNTPAFSMKLRGSILRPELWDEFAHIRVLCPNCHVLKTLSNKEYFMNRKLA